MQADNDNISKKITKTVMLIDEQLLYREALADLITRHNDLKIIAQTGFNEELLELVGNKKPDLIIMDPCLNIEDNIQLIFKLINIHSDSRILLILSPCSSNLYFDFIRAGISGIVLKTQASSILLKAINRVLSSELWFDRALLNMHQKTERSDRTVKIQDNFLACLSKREREIVNLVAKGLNTISIAQTLYISEKTVRNHIYSIYGKLEVKDRLELALFASRNGISEHDPV